MNAANPFRIAYIGGGSRFVVTLLHGLAEWAEQINQNGRPIELVLMDRYLGRAEEMKAYADITATQAGLDLRATVTDDLDTAVADADWVLFSITQYHLEHKMFGRYGAAVGDPPQGEAGPWIAMTSLSIWPEVCKVAQAVKDRAKDSVVFSSLVNPTDVLAGAVKRKFGLESMGICVEVGGLEGFLAYYLQVDPKRISLDHLGVNHVGWVGKWSIEGFSGDPDALLAETIVARMSKEDWYPHCNWLIDTHSQTGLLRSTAYHAWPIQRAWGEAEIKQADIWAKTCLGDEPKRDFRARMLAEAIAAGRMIEPFDPTAVHPEATPYSYPNSARVLGAAALGLAGGQAPAVTLQVTNGGSNPDILASAVLEVPTIIRAGRIEPQQAATLPASLTTQIALLASQRSDIADWLVDEDRDKLARALHAMPNIADLAAIGQLIEDLTEHRNNNVSLGDTLP